MALRPSESSGAFINRIENVNHVELGSIYQVDVIFFWLDLICWKDPPFMILICLFSIWVFSFLLWN